jgi:tetratricopeptide (TPR) repeat protein
MKTSRCFLVAVLLVVWCVAAGLAQTPPETTPPNPPASPGFEVAAKAAALERQLDQVGKNADRNERILNIELVVASLILVTIGLMTVGATFSVRNLKESMEQQIKAAMETVNSQLRVSDGLMNALDKKHRDHNEGLRLFEQRLDDKQKTMLVNIPFEIKAVKRSLAKLLEPYKVSDKAPIFTFHETLTDQQRQDILMEDSKIPTLLWLSSWRESPPGPGQVEHHAPRPENPQEWARVLTGLATFFASRCYTDGHYKENHDFEKACFYLRTASELTPEDVLARNDLGALLVSVKKVGGDPNEYYLSAENLLKETIKIRPLQRSYCNLAWAYSGQGKHKEAIACLANDKLLDLEFHDPEGPSYRQFVHLTRACVLTAAGGNHREAMGELEQACINPPSDILRIIKESFAPGGELEPLANDEQTANQSRALLAKLARIFESASESESAS